MKKGLDSIDGAEADYYYELEKDRRAERLQTWLEELQAECKQTPNFRTALEQLAATGTCTITPPIVGALVRCGIMGKHNLTGMARKALDMLLTEEKKQEAQNGAPNQQR